MKLEPGQWRCDSCGDVIESVDEGYLQWVTYHDKDGKRRGRGLRIVHHYSFSPRRHESRNGCYYDPHTERLRDQGSISDLDLKYYTGVDGLTRLLAFLVEGELPQDEIIEVIKRIFTPGYEIARPYFREAIDQGIIEPNLPDGLYWDHQIKTVIKNIKYLEH